MSTSISLQSKWDLINAENADYWLRSQGVPQKEAVGLAYKVAGKMSRVTLAKLHEATRVAGAGSLVDTAANWLKLYNLKTFGGVRESCVTDVTAELPVAGLVANGVDMPRLTPELMKSAVGLQTIKEFGADYLLTTSGLKPISGNGLLSLSDKATRVVTEDILVAEGFIMRETPQPKIISLLRRSPHRSFEVWADRTLRNAKGAGHKITEQDLLIVEASHPQIARAMRKKMLNAF